MFSPVIEEWKCFHFELSFWIQPFLIECHRKTFEYKVLTDIANPNQN